MSLISRLGVVLGLDTAEFSSGLGKAQNDLGKFGKSSAMVGGAVAALGTAFVAASYQAITFADGINDIAKANEMSVGTVLEFSQALSTNGGSAENASKLLASFTNKVDEAASGSQKTRDKFKDLGISLKDLGNLSETDLLQKTIDGLAKIEDPIKRNAMAFDLLGKAAKGVDIKGMNEEFQRINGTMEGSDKSFAKIGDALDRLDRLNLKMKTDFANNIAEPVSVSTQVLEKFYASLKSGNNILDEQSKKLEKYGISFKNIFLGGVMQTMRLGQVLNGFKKNQVEDETNRYTPQTDTTEYKPNFNSNNLLKRATPLSDEDIKRAAAAQKITDSMRQQSLEINRQLNAIELEQSGYEKLVIEFEKGGKYYTLRGTKQAQHLLDQQKELDQETEKFNRAKEVAKQAIALEAEQRAERESRAKDVAQIAIKQAQVYQTSVETAQLEKERLDYSTTLIGQSDTQVAKAMELFDIEKEIIKLKKDNPFMSDKELQDIKNAKVAVVESQEVNTRAANTFQAGWDKALSNYSEKLKDSSALGAEAFTTITSRMGSALDNFVSTGKLSFGDLAQSIIADLLKIQLKASMTSLFGGLFGGGDATGGMGNIFTSSSTDFANGGGLLGFLGFADGGNPPVGQPSIVGERGPELFVPKIAGTIVPNHSLSSMMGSQPQVVYNGTVVQNMSAIDTQSATQFLAKNKQAVWASNMSAQRSLPMSR